MKNITKLLIILLSVITGSISAQNVSLTAANNGTTKSQCTGSFFDSGGNASDYTDNENRTITFCPSIAGDAIQLDFTSFITEDSYDFLYIYDGTTTAATSLGVYTGTIGPGIVQATSANASGCITIRFTSDNSFFSSTEAGWKAVISCFTPCQTINSVFNSSTPAPGAGGIIRVCVGQSVTFNGSGTFSSSGTGATYTWDFDNGLTGSGTSASTTYTAPGAYYVNLNINQAGCLNNNKLNQVVQVSTTPSFLGTTTSTNSICLGQSATLIGSVTPTPFSVNCTPPVSGTTFLPDGTGASYSTCITVDCFASTQKVTSITDIQNVCLNMEHSYIGDLDIKIQCPNGQQVTLKAYPGSGAATYLGAPLDDPTVGPGVGANYCFAMSGTQLLINGPTVSAGTPANSSVVAGTYSPQASFSGLVGCPLNGNWCIKVTDNLGADNGYIFNWDVNFAAGLTPPSQSFTPTIVSETWNGPAALTQVGNNATVTPTSLGSKCYTLTAVDNFGCSYNSAVQCITVNPGPYAGVSNTVAMCNSAASTNLFPLLGAGTSTTGTWAGAPALTGAHLGTFNPAALAAGVYNYTYTVPASGGCPATSATIAVTIRPNPAATLSFTNPTCGNNNGIVVINNTSCCAQTISTFTSNLGTVSGQTVTALGASTPVITLTNSFGCTFTVSATLTMTPGPTAITTPTTTANCGLSNGSFTISSSTGGTPAYTYSLNGVSTPTIASGLIAGTYTLLVKDANGCIFTKNVIIPNTPGPSAITVTTTPAGCGVSNGSYTITGVTGGTAAYTYSVDGVSTGSVSSALAGGVHTALVKDVNGCTYSTTVNIGSTSGPTAATVTIANATCGNANGSATVTAVTGGLAPLQYSFNGGAFSATNNVGALTAGTKTVVVKDANGCTITLNFTVTNAGSPTASIAATSSVTCNGGATGSFTVNASGGTPGYGYTITPTGVSNTTGLFISLTAQTYTINVKDAAGCTFSLTNTVTQPTALTLTLTPLAITCNGANNGTITAAGGNGTPTYQYALDGGGFQVGTSFTGLTPGTHSVTVKDNNNCTLTLTTTITQPTPLALTFTTTATACVGSTGTATIGVTGGVAAYSYSVDAVTASSTPGSLAFGTHTVTVKDFNGCIITGTLNTPMVTGPTATTITPTNATCGSANGSATVTTVTGGLAAYQYSFDGGAFSLSNNTGALLAGTHTVVVRDANSCTLTVNYNINNTGSPTSTIASSVNVNCFGGSTGSFTVNTVGGTPGFNYTLTPGGTTNTTGIFTSLTAQPYNVTVKDAVGCVTTVSITLTQPTALTLTLTPSNVSCNAGNNGTITANGANGTGLLQYSLNGGAFQAGTAFTPLTSGVYSVTVRDANNCTLTQTTTITQPTAVTMTVTSSPNTCAGGVGSATISASGGTPIYSYSVDAISSSNNPTGLASGTHTATAKDNNGCLITSTFSVGLITGPVSLTVTTTNATCGMANGSSTVTGVTGGLASYQYSFDGSAFSTTANTGALLAGTHTLTVLDANSCTLTTTYNVLNTGSPTANITATTNVTCNGLSNGSFTVAGSGGSGAPFTYTLSVPSFVTNGTGQFTGLPAGTYTPIIRDASGCTTTATVTLSQPTVLTASASSLPAKCFGANTGTITATGGGGVGPYQYSLNGAAYQVSNTYTAVGAGIYSIDVKDNNGCIQTTTVQVTQPALLAIGLTSQNANCTAANGIITTTVTGGTPIYTYTWTGGGGAGATTNSLVSGTYSVTVTDSKGCVITGSSIIGNTPGGTASITASTNVTCNGANNGSATVGMTGGSAPFTYSWTPGGQTGGTGTNLAPATYSCVVTDFYGCKSTATVTITQPSILSAIMNSNNVKCFGTATGTVSAAGTGGTGPYTYLWPTQASTLSTVNNVLIGTYTCNITDANNCTISRTIAVTEPSPVTLSYTATPANCNQANGSATVTAAGGTPAYSYTWSTGVTGPVLSSVAAGTYTINVQDGNNCLQTLAATISNLSGPSISVISQTNVSCFGGNNGIATVSVTGGTTPFIYQWSNGQVTPTGTGLLAGVHTVSVTDNAGCVASTSVNITQPTALTVNINPTHPKCFGSTDGSGLAAAIGGTPSYTYAWTTTGGSSASSNPYGAGQHGVTVTDGNGCTAVATMTLVNPPAMAASITSTNVTCFNACNGLAVGSSTNGVGAVSYVWTGGASPVNGQSVSGLCPAIYTLTATDQNNCTGSAQVTITQPTQVTANITSSGSVTCNGGTNGFAQVTPGGGSPAYTYTWTGVASGSGSNANNLPAGTYTVTVGDLNGCTATTNVTILEPAPLATTLTPTNPKCNTVCDGTGNVQTSGGAGLPTFLWQPGLQGGNFVNSLCAGNQTVTITYNGTCQTSLTFTLTDPPLLTAAVTPTNSHCQQNDGRACATVGGGTAPLQYLWSNGPTTLCNNNIVGGAYTFTVTDANLCTAQASGIVNDIAGPSVAITSTVDVKCNGGFDGGATASIVGGTPTYNIIWTGVQAGPNTSTVTTNFGAGLHNVQVTDAAGCVGSASVTIAQPAPLTSAIGSFTNVTCFGLTNGGATMLVNGGTANYNYTWTPSAQTSSVMVSVGANTYTCNVKDANGCATSKTVTIGQPPLMAMGGTTVTNITCFGSNNGQIVTNVTGGTPGYNYTWNPAQGNNGVIGSLAAGGYTLSVLDQHNCPVNANFTVSEPQPLVSGFTSLPATCERLNGSATVTVTGGTQTGTAPFYNMTWNLSPPQTGSVAVNMAPGNNSQCVITDANGCSHTQTVSIGSAPSPIITGFTTVQPLCYGQANGSITVNYTSGTPNYTVAWSAPISQVQTTSGLSQMVSSVASGAYSATVTDTYGCSTTQPVTLAQPNFLALSTSSIQTICYGQTAQIYGSASGGPNPTPMYSYTWTPNLGSTGGPYIVNPTTSTQYTVTVSDQNGCSPSPKIITVNVSPQLAITGFSTMACDGTTTLLTPNITSPGRGAPYDFIWSTGTTHTQVATSSVIVPANYATSPNTYTVTIDDRCTIPSASAVFTVVVNPAPVINFTATPRQGCAPLTVTLTGTSNNPSTDQYSWLTDAQGFIGSNNPLVYTFNTGDTISVDFEVTSAFGCKNRIAKNDYIIVYPVPVAAFTANPPVASILDPNINFINQSQGATNYFWDFGDPAPVNGNNTSTLVDPNHTYSNSGIFNVYLKAISAQGCTNTTMMPVEITPDFALYVPNTFTPDGNGTNDVFQPMGVGINEDNYRMDIFDRWGEVIFTSNNFRKGWDGSVKGNSKMAPQGVYVYKLTVFDVQGNKHPFIGHVTVIRSN
jgi:gliding motility-associated-like protein